MKKPGLLILFLFPALLSASEPDCEKAISTLDINRCASIELDAAEREMRRYLEMSLERNGHDVELVASIQQAQAAWEVYAEAHCGSIYTQWRQGTIRGVMHISCRTRLARERTHELWSAFLTNMDSTEPVLPEPAKE